MDKPKSSNDIETPKLLLPITAIIGLFSGAVVGMATAKNALRNNLGQLTGEALAATKNLVNAPSFAMEKLEQIINRAGGEAWQALPGHTQKALDALRDPGTILGKAKARAYDFSATAHNVEDTLRHSTKQIAEMSKYDAERALDMTRRGAVEVAEMLHNSAGMKTNSIVAQLKLPDYLHLGEKGLNLSRKQQAGVVFGAVATTVLLTTVLYNLFKLSHKAEKLQYSDQLKQDRLNQTQTPRTPF